MATSIYLFTPDIQIIEISNNERPRPVDPWAAAWQLYGVILRIRAELPNASIGICGRMPALTDTRRPPRRDSARRPA